MGLFRILRLGANGRNNSQHCCVNNVGSFCVCWQWCAKRCNNSQQVWDLHCIVGRIQPISLCKPCVMSVRGPAMLEELYKRILHCCATLRRSRNKRNVGSFWLRSLTGFKSCATTCNMVCKRTKHVTSNNVGSCWPTMLRPFARGFTVQAICVPSWRLA